MIWFLSTGHHQIVSYCFLYNREVSADRDKKVKDLTGAIS